MNHLIYLACPYQHKDKHIMWERFNAVTEAAGHLMAEGKVVFSPITHCHPIAERYELPRGWKFWEKFDKVYLGHSEEMIILPLPGWKESTGVTAEIGIMREQGKPIFLLDPVEYTLTSLGS